MRTALLLAAAGVLLAACAPAAAPPTAAPAPAADEHAVLLRLADRRELEDATLRTAVTAADPAVARRAAGVLANLRLAAGVPLLATALASADTSVAAAAAFALGQIGDTTAVPLLAPLVDAARISSTPTLVGEAAYALAKLRHPRAKEALERLLAGAPLSGPGVLKAVGPALLGIWRQARPSPVPAIARWLDAPDAELRWRAAYALTRRAEPAATAALFRAAADPDAMVRSMVARSLGGAMADSSGIGRGAAQDALVRMATGDPSQIVRINALRSLGTYPDARSLRLLGDRIAANAEPYEVIVALESLGRMGKDAASAAPLLGEVARDPGRQVFIRQTAIAALLQLDPQEAVRTLPHIEHAPEWRLRASAARVYAAVDSLTRRQLLTVVEDPDGRIASAALEQALEAVGDSGVAELRPVLLSVLDPRRPASGVGSMDVIARTNALGGMARLADPATLPVVLEAYGRAQADTLDDAALAAVDAVAAIAKKDPSAAGQFLGRFPRSGDYLVRQRVQAAFGDSVPGAWGAPLPIETGLGPAEYARVVQGTQARPRPHAVIETSRGEIEVELFADDAPLTSRSFLSLAARGFFDGQEWPRVVPNFVIQGGDPRGDTSGGPGYTLRDEINRHTYGRGTLGMALSGPETGGSQWFITHSPQPHLDGTYTVFGQVVRGMEVVDAILPGDRIIRIREVP
jgi:cyclophilin family peptidyl-prolyl cis-trans isomerase/HEAT repeat protein